MSTFCRNTVPHLVASQANSVVEMTWPRRWKDAMDVGQLEALTQANKAQKGRKGSGKMKNGTTTAAAGSKAANGNPYMKGGLRAAIFAAGSKGYASRAELAKTVAKTTKHAAVKVGFQIAVVANAAHPGQNNGKQGGQGKSKEVVKGDRRFLVAV